MYTPKLSDIINISLEILRSQKLVFLYIFRDVIINNK